MIARTIFSLTRYPVVEIVFALVAGVVGVLTDKSSQPVFSFVLYALSGVVGLAIRPVVNRTPFVLCWIYFVAGIVVLLAEFFYFGRIETGIFDIFLFPLGLGILLAATGSVIHRSASKEYKEKDQRVPAKQTRCR